MSDGYKIWLWKNGDHFLGYTHLYPCYENGDPMVLGEPIGYALVKSSLPREFFGQQVSIGGLNAQPIQNPQPPSGGEECEHVWIDYIEKTEKCDRCGEMRDTTKTASQKV